MDEIKSAFERAMERVKNVPDATPLEKLAWKWVPAGQKLATQYLRDQSTNLSAELAKFGDTERPHVMKGIMEVLVANLTLPRNPVQQQTNEKVLRAIETIKRNRAKVQELLNYVRTLMNQYTQHAKQQHQQVYQQVKTQFQAELQRAIQQQRVNIPQGTDVDNLPEFQQHLRRALFQIDEQYDQHLREHKARLLVMD